MSSTLRPRFLPDRDAAREWGGKGAPLARMVRKGFAVPPTAAMGLSEVQSWLESLPEYAPAIQAWALGSDETRAVGLRALGLAILSAPMPDHWPLSAGTLRQFLCGDSREEYVPAEGELTPWPMILRSSMSAEDSVAGSLAGCFESVVVHQTTAVGLWKGFTEVVASAFRLSSADRLLGAGVDPRKFRAAVVIQPYLTAELAGVCFSRDPSNPWDRDSALVEWVRGAGEALVQGTGEANSRRFSEGAGDSELAPFWEMLWKKARKAEKIVGGPADLEWVWDGAQLWFVQARPIATEEARLAARAPTRRWSRGLTLERFPEPLTPMGWSVLQDAFAVNLKTLDHRFGVVAKHPTDMAVSVRGTVYSDPHFFAFPSGVRIRWGKHLNPLSSAPWKALGSLGRFVVRLLLGRGGAVSGALLRLDLVQAFLGREAGLIETSWDQHRDQSVRLLAEFASTMSKLEAPGLTETAVLERMEVLTAIGRDFMEPDLAVYLIKDSLNKALLSLCRALGWDEAGFTDLFRSFEGNRTLEMNGEWKECLAALSQDPGRDRFVAALEKSSSSKVDTSSLSEPARAAWERFLARNGHTTTNWDIAALSWGERPAQLAPLLKAALSSPPSRRLMPSGLREQSREKLFRQLGRASRRRVEASLARLEAFMRIDEEHHFLSGLLLAPSRKLIVFCGDCLVQQGLLASREDVFFLEYEELKKNMHQPGQGFSYRLLTRRRRSEWERARKANPPFELPLQAVLSTGGELAPGTWQGTPMSPGTAVGRAVIAEHIDQVSGIEAGSILITTSPNPALTPLYPLLGGLVSATGSALSHGFVSAREYQLPAVSGIGLVTEKIPAGAMVRVDGTTGQVEVLA